MEIKHGGCWYCASKSQETLTAIQKQVIDKDGKLTSGGYALCDTCKAASVLDQRIPLEQRRA